ncbi:hypothetical protein CRYUN_Cryun28dG0026000 [Craigia yunnanensis]
MDSYRVLRYVICHLAVSLIVSIYSIEGRVRDLSIEANVESDGKFNSVKRNAVKTIKTIYGDEYDCVELYKQPALDHRLLKNHKIQMRPSFDTQRDVANPIENGSSSTSIHVGLMNISCPLGTVPIRRRRSRAELLRAKAMFRQHFRSFHTSTKNYPTGYVVSPSFSSIALILIVFLILDNNFVTRRIMKRIGTAKKEATVYHGAGGLVSINNPVVNYGQFSATVISIEGGPGPADQFSVIRVGWMQSKNGQMYGCYNTYCSGFVQTDATIALDMILEPISVVRGPQFYVKLAVSQDKSTGNWWLIYGENNTPVGYWSSSLFSNLQNGADALRWGGRVYSNTSQLPPMGNGDNGDIHSSHFRQIVLKYESGSSLNGNIDVPLEVIQTSCYKSGDNSYKNEYWGYSFYFGGDGGDVSQCS